jgi:ComF family protein
VKKNNMHTLLSKLCHSFLDLVYPPICLYCKNPTSKGAYFCHDCSKLLELIDPEERCPYCFSADFCLQRGHCYDCFKHPPVLDKIAAALDYIGPAACLIKRMKYGNMPYLSEGAAAFLVAQWDRLGWDVPDLIIPVPQSFTHWLERGYNQSALIAEEMGKLLGVPVLPILKRDSGDYSQAGLTYKQRRDLDGKNISFKKRGLATEKTVLLIDDVITTGTTLEACGRVLFEDFPAKIYALAVCKAI